VAAEAARAGWGRWERESLGMKLAVLGEDGPGRWRPLSGEAYRYSDESGLIFLTLPVRG